MIPAPMPVPTVMKAQVSCPRATPFQRSPRIARLTSLSTKTGAPTARRRSDATGTSFHPLRFGASALTTPCAGIDGARRPDADREQAADGHARLAQEAAQLRGDLREEARRASIDRRRNRLLRDHLAAQVGHRQGRVRRGDVDAGDEAVAAVELHEGGPPAAAGRPGAEVAEQAAANQVGGEAADGRRRQVGVADDLGAGERALALHRHEEHAFEIQAAQVRRVPRPVARQ